MLKLWGNVDAGAAAGGSPNSQGAASPPPFLNAAAEQTKEYLQRISQAPLSSVLWERSLAELQRLLQQEQLQ